MCDFFRHEVDRCLTCKNPSCMSGCALRNSIPDIIHYLRLGEFAKATETVGHPFGEICGYVCPHENACQGACVLGKRGGPIQTGMIERELFARYPYEIKRRGNALNGKRYAVIGGGVSGLTFAAKVYEQGAEVTLYERDELLSTIKLIPSVRLPKEAVLRAEQAFAGKIDILREQVDSELLKTLQNRFDGVYVSTGLTVDYGLGVEGQAFATNYRDCLKGNYKRGTVVVVGGGNSAMDCARLARLQGSQAIIAYRRTERDMPAFSREIADARNEGVEFAFNVAPVKLRVNGDKLQLTLAKTVSEGRGKLIVTSDEFTVECDSVISAIGSKFDSGILSMEKNDEPYLQYDNVYLGGDAKRGKLVVDAVADGLNVAKQIIDNARKICL